MLGAFLVLVVTAVWADQPGRFTPDTVPALYTAPDRLLDDDLSAWVPDPWLGSPQLQTGRAPVSAVLAALASTGLPDWALVRLWRSALLVVGALGAFALYRQWAGRSGTGAGAVVAALVYTANPYVVVGASTTPTLLPYVLLPWAVLHLVRALRSPGWGHPAAFALVLLLMSGIQVGVVPLLQLLVVPAAVLDAVVRGRRPVRAVLAAVVRCGVLALVVSLYWVVPALAALSTGTAVATATETTEAIAGPSSAAEVLRGLGMWTMYGRDAAGPFQPGFASYLTSPVVVLASFALPALAAAGAAVSRGGLRLAGATLVGLAVPVMVGVHPPDDPSPFGRALEAGFATVPGLVALRTTNKAGGVLLLGTALLVALLAEALRRRVTAPRARAALAGAAAVVLLGSVAPAVAGPLAPVQMELPAYWTQVAADLDQDPGRGRVLVLPGTHVPQYRWGFTSSGDHLEGLFRRGTVQRQSIPNGSPQAASLLAGLDTALQEGSLTPGTISAVARYLGVRDVVVRHDLLWERAAGARPVDVALRVGADPGLSLVRGFGAPGENVVSEEQPGTPEQLAAERALPPVQHFAVADARDQLRAEPLAGTVLVAGDGNAVPDLLATGVLADQPPFRLLGGMDADELAEVLDGGARVVLTDTARRREASVGRLTAGSGPTLAADAAVERLVLPFADPRAQTVSALPGARVTATRSGSVFGPVPFGGPALALDGDARTGWLAGDFGRAEGERLDLALEEPATVGRVTLVPLPTAPAQLEAVRLRVGDVVRDVELRAERVVVDLPVRPVDGLSVTVLRASAGDNAVGLAELQVDGLPLEPTTQLPRTLSDLASRLPPAALDRLTTTPLDVVLSRSRGVPFDPTDDEEVRLSREFTTVGTRTYDVGGVLQAGLDVPEQALDTLAGYAPDIAATTTSRFFDDPALRGSAALDGDSTTAWLPGRAGTGESLTVAFPSRQVDSVVVQQPVLVGGLVDLVTRVRVTLEDGRSVDADLRPGATTVDLPPGPPTGLVQLTLLERAGDGSILRIEELGIPGVSVAADPVRAASACVPVMALSGAPLGVRADLADVLARRPTPFSSCSPPVRLGPGAQSLRTAPGWLLDRVHLLDVTPGLASSAAGQRRPAVAATSSHPTSWRIEVDGPTAAYGLLLGQGWDPRWRAELDGEDLGEPVVLDGWSAGWRVDRTAGPHTVEVRYAPQRTAVVARAVSLAAVGLCVLLLLARRRRRRAVEAPAAPSRQPARGGRWGVAGWLTATVLLWFFGGALLGVAGLVMAAGSRTDARAARALPWLAVLLISAVPVTRVLEGLSDAGTLSSAAVTGGLPQQLAMLGAAVLVVGVLQTELSRSPEPTEERTA